MEKQNIPAEIVHDESAQAWQNDLRSHVSNVLNILMEQQ